MTDTPAFPTEEMTRNVVSHGMTLTEYAVFKFIAAEVSRAGFHARPMDEVVTDARAMADAALSHRRD